jgi:hypothetical protein
VHWQPERALISAYAAVPVVLKTWRAGIMGEAA